MHCADRERARTGTAGVAEGGGKTVSEETEAGERVYWGGEWEGWSTPAWIVNLAEKMNSLS